MLKSIFKLVKKLIKLSFYGGVIIGILSISINFYINKKAKPYIFKDSSEVPKCYTALVLGAFVYKNGYPSGILRDRLDKAIELYKKKKIKRFLLSGDHGTIKYDEVNNMKNYLISKGIHSSDIFLDHAGFDTYNSVVRANKVFKVSDVIIVTQEFHLSRAVYIAREKGLKAYGFIADKLNYPSLPYLKKREFLAKIKAFVEVAVNRNPKFFGPEIPITGNSSLSHD